MSCLSFQKPSMNGTSGLFMRRQHPSQDLTAIDGTRMGRTLKPGAYGPLPTFFTDDQEIDYSAEERVQLIEFIRSTLDEAGLLETPIVAGVGGSSTRETIALARAAAQAGACGGSIGKLIRLKAAINADPSINASRPYPFLLLDGLIADLTPWMQCGGHGTVSGIPNFAPASSIRLWELLNQSNLTEEESREAGRIQAILSNADVAAVPAGVRGMKYVLNKLYGYGVSPRKPLLPLKSKDGEKLMEQFKEMLDLEAEYN
ncbi:hypothetical protein SCUP234_07033 [Seiridium cupressi]